MAAIHQIQTSTGFVVPTSQIVPFNPFPGTNNVAITGSGAVPVSFQVRSTISGTNVGGTPASSAATLGEFSFKSSNGTVTATTGTGGLSVVDFDVVPFRASNEWYVAKNGNDTTGTGAPSSPYLTIQTAINAAEAAVGTVWTSTSAIQVIYVAPGVYAENLTINKGFVRITTLALQTGDDGESTTPSSLIGAQNVLVQPASGNAVTINTSVSTGTTQSQRTVSFQGIVIDASLGTGFAVSCTTGSFAYTLSFAYCRLIARALALRITSTALTQFYKDVVFLQTSSGSTSNLVDISRGSASFVDCNFSVAAGNDSSCLAMSSTGTLAECSRCNFFSASNPAATASKPIIVIDGSASTATPISNCLFAYTTVPTVPRGATSSAIHVYGTAPVGLLLFNNLFWLLGTDAVTGRIMTAAGTPALCYGSNNVAPLGFAYKSNVTIQSLVPIATA
jgi:hypothetical protein